MTPFLSCSCQKTQVPSLIVDNDTQESCVATKQKHTKGQGQKPKPARTCGLRTLADSRTHAPQVLATHAAPPSGARVPQHRGRQRLGQLGSVGRILRTLVGAGQHRKVRLQRFNFFITNRET